MIEMSFDQWAARWNIPAQALDELRFLARAVPVPAPGSIDRSEAAVSANLQIETGRRRDIVLFRNNVGALKDERGIPVRYGLANESAAQNRIMKSADHIGVWRRLIQPEDVGTFIGQIVSAETKREGWKYSGQGRESAQLAWANFINAMGGIAFFHAGPGPAFENLPEN